MIPAGRLSSKHRTLRQTTAGIDSIPAGWPSRSCRSNSAVGALRSDRALGSRGSNSAVGALRSDRALGSRGSNSAVGALRSDRALGSRGSNSAVGALRSDRALGSNGAVGALQSDRSRGSNGAVGALWSDRALRSCGSNGALWSDRALRSCGALQTQCDRVYFLLACSAIWAGTCLERVEIVLLAKDVRAGGRGDISCRHCQCCQTYDERNETFPHPTSH